MIAIITPLSPVPKTIFSSYFTPMYDRKYLLDILFKGKLRENLVCMIFSIGNFITSCKYLIFLLKKSLIKLNRPHVKTRGNGTFYILKHF